MKFYIRLLISIMFFALFWNSCDRQTSNQQDVESASSETQVFGLFTNRNKSGIYAETLTGTPITRYTIDYFELSPAAQKIVTAHEEVHQRQNPFKQSHACRELEAYRLQLDLAKIWLHENNGDQRFDKEANDVHLLYFDAQEMLELFGVGCSLSR